MKNKLNSVENLRELRDFLNEIRKLPDEESPLTDQDYCALPTFGGRVPRNTSGIFSWDKKNLLMFNSVDGEGWAMFDRMTDHIVR